MDLVNVMLGESLILRINNKQVVVNVFKTEDPSNFKLGIEAPSTISVNREEIYIKKQEKLKKTLTL